MVEDYKELLFPYQRGLYDRIKSYLIFDEYFQNENMEFTLQDIAPSFQGICTQHYQR
jgi:hypothetical protein